MANTAAQTAANAEADQTNDPGYCLQQCRIWAGINSMYPDASTAWRNTNDRYPGNRNPPRGSMVYWTGGSEGFGHIACSLGGGNIRSTDAGGSGIVATRSLEWFDTHWYSLDYAGWAWDVNEVTIPHDQPKPEPEDDMPDYVTASIGSNKKLKANTWTPIEWDKGTDKYVKPGTPGVSVQGPYSATVTIGTDRPDGAGNIQVSWVEWDTNKNDAAETSGVDSMGGVDNGVSSRIGSVGKDRLLRVRVRVTGSKDCTLTRAGLNLLAFRPK